MAPIETRRCPSCGVLNATDRTICNRCLSPLDAPEPEPAMTDETCHLYRAPSGAALLLSRSQVEYSADGISMATTWGNVASVARGAAGAVLWLYQTPRQIRISPDSALWFGEATRSIPLRPFGYPASRELVADLARLAPQLRRSLPDLT